MTKRNRNSTKNLQQTQLSSNSKCAVKTVKGNRFKAEEGSSVIILVQEDGNIFVPWYFENIKETLEDVGEIQFPGKKIFDGFSKGKKKSLEGEFAKFNSKKDLILCG